MMTFDITSSESTTLHSREALEGIDWFWMPTTSAISTDRSAAHEVLVGRSTSLRVTRGVEFVFANYESLLTRLAE